MNNKPLVSVIMIFLNAEKFIREAIESVLAQTYDTWELVLVDDGSTDSSTRIALQYAQQYPEQVRYFQHHAHQNRGMSASRNLGIREARGEYLALLDADDIYLPQKLEQQVAILRSQPTAAMVYSATQYWYSWAAQTQGRPADKLRTLGVPPDTLIEPPNLFMLFLRNKARTPATCSVLLRRQAFERVGGFEESFRGMFEDQVFFYKLCLNAPVFVQSGCWDLYRQHPESWSQVKRRSGEWDPGPRLSPSHEAFLIWLERYSIEQQITDRECWKVLHKELWPYRHPILYRPLAMMQQASRFKTVVQKLAQRAQAKRGISQR